jgi:hypothetical protein
VIRVRLYNHSRKRDSVKPPMGLSKKFDSHYWNLSQMRFEATVLMWQTAAGKYCNAGSEALRAKPLREDSERSVLVLRKRNIRTSSLVHTTASQANQSAMLYLDQELNSTPSDCLGPLASFAACLCYPAMPAHTLEIRRHIDTKVRECAVLAYRGRPIGCRNRS